MTNVRYERVSPTRAESKPARGTIDACGKLSQVDASLQSLGLTTQVEGEHIRPRSITLNSSTESQHSITEAQVASNPRQTTRHTGEKKWLVR